MEYENESGYREFPSGATRDTALGKLEISRYTHPAVFKRYAQFMKSKQVMPDGDYRRGDNWQAGIPEEELLESLMRHVTDIWLHIQGWGEEAEEDIQTACCSAIFNVSGILLHALTRSRNGSVQREASRESQKAARGDRSDLRGDVPKNGHPGNHVEGMGSTVGMEAVHPGRLDVERPAGPSDNRDRAFGGSPFQGAPERISAKEPVS